MAKKLKKFLKKAGKAAAVAAALYGATKLGKKGKRCCRYGCDRRNKMDAWSNEHLLDDSIHTGLKKLTVINLNRSFNNSFSCCQRWQNRS